MMRMRRMTADQNQADPRLSVASASEDAKGMEETMNVPMPDLDATRLAEAEELYKQGRFVVFKEANARRKAERQCGCCTLT
jgi:hypothetical protein